MTFPTTNKVGVIVESLNEEDLKKIILQVKDDGLRERTLNIYRLLLLSRKTRFLVAEILEAAES